MSETLKIIQCLVRDGHVRLSEHGRDELAIDSIALGDIFRGVYDAQVVEDYPDYHKAHRCYAYSTIVSDGLFTCFGAQRRKREILLRS